MRVVRLEGDVGLVGPAVPFGREADRAEDLPAAGVGHGQRQAAIGVAVEEALHPRALRAAGHDVRRTQAGRVALQFHVHGRSSR